MLLRDWQSQFNNNPICSTIIVLSLCWSEWWIVNYCSRASALLCIWLCADSRHSRDARSTRRSEMLNHQRIVSLYSFQCIFIGWLTALFIGCVFDVLLNVISITLGLNNWCLSERRMRRNRSSGWWEASHIARDNFLTRWSNPVIDEKIYVQFGSSISITSLTLLYEPPIKITKTREKTGTSPFDGS